jgi:type IV pilus assembly protein PilA
MTGLDRPRREKPLTPRGFSFFGDPCFVRSRERARNSGFTLIELVIVIAVTILIGAAGSSAWHTYEVRAQVATSVEQAAGVQGHVEAAFRQTGVPPANRPAAGLRVDPRIAGGPYLKSIDIVGGRIDLVFGAQADAAIAGQTLSLTPFETADARIVWVCGNETPGIGLHPLGFAGGAGEAPQLRTTIEARYLPPTCR